MCIVQCAWVKLRWIYFAYSTEPSSLKNKMVKLTIYYTV